MVTDEVYEHLVFSGARHRSLASLPGMRERTILCGSASKAYAMTGWRCGWTIGPAEVIGACNTILSHATSNIASITQKAAIAALTGPQSDVERMLAEYRTRRDAVHAWLTAHPAIKCVKPRGAFYLFPDISDLLTGSVKTSAEFAQGLIEQEHVAVTPGEGFDAPGYLRISYAAATDQVEEAMRRMAKFVGSLT